MERTAGEALIIKNEQVDWQFDRLISLLQSL